MPGAPPLAHGRTIKDGRHASDEIVVKGDFFYLYAFLLGLTNMRPDTRLDLMVPPMVVALNRKNCQLLPLRVKSVARLHFGQPLPKGEDIRFKAGTIFQNVDDRDWIADVLVPLVFQANYIYRVSGKSIGLLSNFHTRDFCRLAVNNGILRENLEPREHFRGSWFHPKNPTWFIDRFHS